MREHHGGDPPRDGLARLDDVRDPVGRGSRLRGLAVGYYQLATYRHHPLQSVLWTAGIVAALSLAVWWLRRYGARLDRMPAMATEPC